MKIIIFSKTKIMSEKRGSILYFWKSNVWFSKKQMFSHICFCSKSVIIYCFDWSWWKKSRSYRYIVERRSILIVFLDNCGYSSSTIHQNLMINSFLKINCDLESKPINSLNSVTLKHSGLSCTLADLLLMQNSVTLCIGHPKDTGSLS